jgi:hypothetical protein
MFMLNYVMKMDPFFNFIKLKVVYVSGVECTKIYLQLYRIIKVYKMYIYIVKCKYVGLYVSIKNSLS